MAAVTFLENDSAPDAQAAWQLLKSRSIAQTALTAAQLSQNLRDVNFAESTVEVIDVSSYDSIRIQVWGEAANNDAPVIDCYGWSHYGPGHWIGRVTLAYGNFTSAANTGFHAQTATHRSIRNAYLAATAYRGCDTYTVTADYEQELISDSAGTPIFYQQHRTLIAPQTAAGASPIVADFPSYLNVNFDRSKYKYFGVLVTTLAGTNLGAIFKPLASRREQL